MKTLRQTSAPQEWGLEVSEKLCSIKLFELFEPLKNFWQFWQQLDARGQEHAPTPRPFVSASVKKCQSNSVTNIRRHENDPRRRQQLISRLLMAVMTLT